MNAARDPIKAVAPKALKLDPKRAAVPDKPDNPLFTDAKAAAVLSFAVITICVVAVVIFLFGYPEIA